MESGGEDRSDLSAREPTEYERLVRFVAAPAKRFALAIARYVDERVRDEVIARARADVMTAGGVLAVLDAGSIGPDGDLVGELGSAISRSGAALNPRAICVINLEPLVLSPLGKPQTASSIEDLNRRRDELPTLIQAHMVLWVKDEVAVAFSMAARDLFDIALTYFRFDQSTFTERALPHYTETSAPLQHEDEPDHPRLKREAALLYQIVRDPSTSAPSRADAIGRIGQIERLRRNPTGISSPTFDEALRVWRDEVLPLVERIGDKRSATLTRMNIGSALLERSGAGDHEEAKECFRQALADAEALDLKETVQIKQLLEEA